MSKPDEEPAGAPGTWRPFTFADLDRLRDGDVDEPEEIGDDDDIEGRYQSWRDRVDEAGLIDTARRSGGVQVAMSGAMGIPSIFRPPSPQQAGRAAGAVASDLARGAIEAPRQAIGGVSDAVRNVATGLDHLATWLNDNIADLRLPSTGVDVLDNPLRAIAGDGPQVGPASTTTGGLVRDAARFLTGFIPAMRAMQSAGVGSAAVQAAASGALADFAVQNPSDPNVANSFLDQVPALRDLATSPDDPELLNRARNALIGLGLGGMTEGLIRATRLLAAQRAAGDTAAAELQAQARMQVEATAVDQRLTQVLGDPNAPLVAVRRPDQAAERMAAAEAATAEGGITAPIMAGRAEMALDSGMPARVAVGEPEVMVNFARINTPDDVRSVIGQMVEHYAPDIDVARRGVRSNEATQEAADALGMTVDQVLRRRHGQAFNAEEALAARQLLAASADRLTVAARAAAAPTASPADQYAFRRLLATHYAIQSEVIGARTEAARALQAWSIPAGANPEAVRSIEAVISQSGGYDVSRDLAMRIARMADQGVGADALNSAVRRGWSARTRDAVMEMYVLGLLWGPGTHIANTAGNTLVSLQQVIERGTAAGIGRFLGHAPGERIEVGEATAMMYGAVSGMRDSFRLAWQALKTGQSAGIPGQLDRPRTPAITAAAFNLDEAGGLGRFVDYLGVATRLPGHALAGADALFASVGYRMELHAQAFRQASAESLQGDAFVRRVAELTVDPPSHIRLRAADAALYATFQNEPGRLTQRLMQVRNYHGESGEVWNPLFLVMPFVRTPANIMNYAFERTPLAPFVGRFRADVAAGGARRDLALARVATGTATVAVALDLANNGLITGGGPERGPLREAMMRQGWQPYSIRVGDSWYSYNRLDPFGMLFGLAANTAEVLRHAEIQPEDVDEWSEVIGAASVVVSRSIIDRAYFTGLARAYEAMTAPEQQRPAQMRRFVSQQAASLIPFTSVFSNAERLLDPATREANGVLETIQARIPVLSERLVPRRDLWGQAIGTTENFGMTDEAGSEGPGLARRAYNWASPVRRSDIRSSPIDAELVRLGHGPSRIAMQTSMAGVNVNMREFPRAYDAYVRRAGNELPIPEFGGLGLRDYLNAVVSGEGGNEVTQRDHRRFLAMTEGRQGQRASFISSAITRARQTAARSVIEDPAFGDFRAYWESQRGRRAEQRPDIRTRYTPPSPARQP